MKPENVLLVSPKSDNFDIKIADLGFAAKFDKETGLDLVLGTPLYMAPELVKHERYSEKVDVWSLGVITYQLLCGKTPFDGKNIKKINQNICQKEITFSERGWRNVSENAKDFIHRCLDKNQFTRPGISDLFDHPWIAEVPEQDSQDEEIQLNIQKNLIQYQTCSDFQKIVLSLISGLSATQEELEMLQREFIRLDRDKSGTLNKSELEQMTNSKLVSNYELDWD
jgi:calcium-dependent protein kinase